MENRYAPYWITLKNQKYKTVLTVGRVVVGIGLILFLFWTLDIREIVGNIRSVKITYLAYASISYLVFILVSTWRWQVLLDFKKFDIPFGRTLIIYFISLFFNNFLPTTVGGDMMRVIYTMKGRRTDSLATVIVDRILGFVGLFVFALVAVFYLLIRNNETEFLPFMVVGLSIVVAVTYVFFSERAYNFFSPMIAKVRVFRLGERLNRLHEAGTDFGGAWGTITLCVIHSIIIQATLAIAPFLVLLGMGHSEVGIMSFFVYVPIINVISMIPVSLNGLGIRENSYVLLFSRVGLSGEISLAMSLLSFFIIFVYSLAGGILFLFYKRR